MRIGVIGAGRIGGNVARLLARAGHEVVVSFSRDPLRLERLATAIDARAGTPREAVEHGEVVVLSVPWGAVSEALEQAGPLHGRIVADTTNPFGPEGVEELPGNRTAREVNADRMPGARVVKAFSTLPADLQAEAPERPERERLAMFIAGEDAEAKEIVAGLVRDCGFEPVDVGGGDQEPIMEPPRGPGSVFAAVYRPGDARRIAEAARVDPDVAVQLAEELRRPA